MTALTIGAIWLLLAMFQLLLGKMSLLMAKHNEETAWSGKLFTLDVLSIACALTLVTTTMSQSTALVIGGIGIVVIFFGFTTWNAIQHTIEVNQPEQSMWVHAKDINQLGFGPYVRISDEEISSWVESDKE